MTADVREQVVDIVATIVGVDPAQVDENSSSSSLAGWDSLRHMKLVLAVEEAFRIRFTDDEIVSITDVRSIIRLLARKSGVTS
jgi:acyl carrier protein